jgi:hypothetical protein
MHGVCTELYTQPSRPRAANSAHSSWIEAEPSDVLSAHHPLRTPSTGVSFTQEAPVTAARLPELVDRFLLLDGYHRAAHFWKMAGPASEIAVFVPVQVIAAGSAYATARSKSADTEMLE